MTDNFSLNLLSLSFHRCVFSSLPRSETPRGAMKYLSICRRISFPRQIYDLLSDGWWRRDWSLTNVAFSSSRQRKGKKLQKNTNFPSSHWFSDESKCCCTSIRVSSIRLDWKLDSWTWSSDSTTPEWPCLSPATLCFSLRSSPTCPNNCRNATTKTTRRRRWKSAKIEIDELLFCSGIELISVSTIRIPRAFVSTVWSILRFAVVVP